MFQKNFTSLIAAAVCLSLSAASANAQFNVGRKIGSISKQVGSKVSKSATSLPKPDLRLPSPAKSIGTLKPKLPDTFPKKGSIKLPSRGISLPKSPVTLPKTGIRFPKPVIGMPKPLPIKLPKPGIKPIIIPPNPGTKPLPKPGITPIVPPNPEITPLPQPIKHPRPDDCWKPPHHCHWWTNICAPIRICRPADLDRCHWNVVHCDTVIGGHVVDTRWFLGVEGVFLPGKGLGIESVTERSPAALAGLTSGMVIVQANGIAMETEEAMQQAIASSQGFLEVVLISEGNEQPLQATIQMVRLASARF